MPTFAGRIESKYTVPASTTISVSSGALTDAVSVTLPAASYYHTSAGGVSSGIDALETAINAAVSPYPDSAAAMAAAVGYGTWSAGWGFDIASGNDAGLFGGVTLTASGTPTYGTTGPGHGGDKAIGFDATTEYFSAGDNFDVGATDDLAVAWVGYHAAIPGSDVALFSKRDGNVRWQVYRQATSGLLVLNVSDGANAANSTLTVPINSWYAGIAVLDRGAAQIRVAVRTLAGATTISIAASTSAVGTLAGTTNFQLGASASGLVADTDFKCAALYVGAGASVASGMSTNLSTAATNFASAISSSFSVALSTTDGRVTIANSHYSYSLTWTSTTLRDLLGFDANITSQTTATGAKQAKALWLPDSPLNADSHPSMYPDETDTRGSESPTGVVLGLSGNVKYVHENVRYDRVPVDRIRESSATYANASLEVFFRDCISGMGHSWFRPLSPLQFYWSNAGTDTLLGSDANSGVGVAGWAPVGISKFRDLAVPSQPGWVGAFNVRFPRLVSNG